ncbi:MAG: NYN domain-containing protein [Clostridium sp.]
MDINEKRFALLIDSDNVSAKYIKKIINELDKYGIITYKRIYGDWTSTQATKWKEKLLDNSITPIQQFSNTVGKNATDSALIIDAMDILYTNNVDGFCIVSSDSDFTRLASRLRESGMNVIGMGEKKTPQAFRSACNIFTNLEVLIDQVEDIENIEPKELVAVTKNPGVENNQVKNISKEAIEKAIVDIINENENEGKKTDLGEIGKRLRKKYTDFDVRNYGYSLLSKFLMEMETLNLIKDINAITVTLKENKIQEEKVKRYIIKIITQKDKKEIGLSELSNTLHSKYKNFNIKDYGYSSFSKFIQSINELELLEGKTRQKRVIYKQKSNTQKFKKI